MSSTIRLSLKAGERIFINGAVLRADRKVGLELLNDATFLLEHHVIGPDETSTPLRQLYFMVQTMLMDPKASSSALQMCRQSLTLLRATFTNRDIVSGLGVVAEFLDQDRPFEALKAVRVMLPIEAAILGNPSRVADQKLEMIA
jgi:flagellar protein FlbT